MPILSTNTYGKNRVRLVRVRRSADRTEMIEWTIRILFEGDYLSAYESGDNSAVLPTDTMKNTVYSLARESPASSPEEFAMDLAGHFLTRNPEVSNVSIEIAEKPWEQVHPSTFRLDGNELQIASVKQDRHHVDARSGFTGLSIMKTSHSGFEGFKKDRLTTLPETADRLLGTNASAEWGYAKTQVAYRELRELVRGTLLKKFADHKSKSVQHTLYAMGEAVLAAAPEVTDIRLAMPNIHCLLVDLSRFGQDNPNEIFVPIDEPHGTIEAHITRD